MTDATALLRECRALCEDGDGLIDSEALAARIDAYLAAAPTPDVRLTDATAWRIDRTVCSHNHPTRYWETSIVDAAGNIIARTSGATEEEAIALAERIAAAPTPAQPVACECGDRYADRSWESGFLAGRGHCINCACARGESLEAPPARAAPGDKA